MMKSLSERAEIIERLNPDGFGWVQEALPPPPSYWKLLQRGEDGYSCLHRITGLSLIASGSRHSDGRRWIHISVAHHNRMPTYQELSDVKRDFIGEDRYAYQVFAAKKDHVNFHPFALHLFSCLDEPDGMVLPDFTEQTGSV